MGTPSTLLEEETTRNNRPGESTTRDEVTTEASSTVVMTHTYVMQERKNGSRIDTEEIAPVKAPEDGIADNKGVANTKDPSFLDRIQEERSRDQENDDGTSYRTEKSISKVVTQISV